MACAAYYLCPRKMKQGKMIFNQKTAQCFLAVLLVFSSYLKAQNTKEMTIDDITAMAVAHHAQLKLNTKNIDIAKQQKEVTRLKQLPDISASATAFYLGNALIVDKDFSNTETMAMPHFGNTYAVEATELLYKGGLIKKSLEAADLKTQLVELDLENNKQNIIFLVISNYLDMLKLINQKKVYENNRQLAQQRLDQIRKFYSQGMITRNEVIRGELIIQNLDQALLTISNNKSILNYNLDQATGLPTDTEIIPKEQIQEPENEENLSYFLHLAYDHHPLLKSAGTSIQMASKNLEIINTEKKPTLAAFGGYNMQKPITNTLPVVDMYSNTWEAGISLSYNIDNLYKSKKKEELGQLQKEQAEDALNLTKQNIEMAVNAAYLKYQEAVKNAAIQRKSQELAQENYKIIEAKYLNQLAVQVEMTDATQAKLEAEISYVNAEINVLYQYYQLLKTTGTLY